MKEVFTGEGIIQLSFIGNLLLMGSRIMQPSEYSTLSLQVNELSLLTSLQAKRLKACNDSKGYAPALANNLGSREHKRVSMHI